MGIPICVSGFLLKSRFLPWKQPETRNQKPETKHTQTIRIYLVVLSVQLITTTIVLNTMFATRITALLLVFLISTFCSANALAQALESEALADGRRQAVLESLEKIIYEQYTILLSDKPTEDMRMDMLLKDQLVLWERIKESQNSLMFYDVAELMSSLADNYYVLRERMHEMAFQPAELTESANTLRERLSEYVDMEEMTEPGAMPDREAAQDDIPDVPEPPGFAFNAGYTMDAMSMADGGAESGTGIAQVLNVTVGLDLERAAGMKGSSMFFQGLYHQGNGISKLAGDWQGISNNEAPDAIRLFQAWFEQKLFSGRGSILMGLYNLNTEFYALSSAGLFVNNGFGIGAEFGRTGRNGPSIAPVTSLALRFAVQTPSNNYFMLGVLDGVPGDPDDITRTHISLSSEDGALVNAEGGYKFGDYMSPGEQYLKIGVGYWTYTAPQDEILNADDMGIPAASKGNHGWYALMEGTVFNESQNSSDGLTLYARMGVSDKKYNDIGFSWSAGLVYNGLIPGRSNDALGLAITSIIAGDDFQDAAGISGLQLQTAESVIEFTYMLAIANWLTIQPDLQYVINPGLGLQADKTLAAGGRFMIGF